MMPPKREKTMGRIVPEFEPEVIHAIALRSGGKMKIAPTTAIRSLLVDGIEVTSIYRNAEALRATCQLIEALDVKLRELIAEISCFGRKNDGYLVRLLHCSGTEIEEIADRLEMTCLETMGHHSGIFLCCPDQWYGRRYDLVKRSQKRSEAD